MAYQATVFNVMIASPGDVEFERNAVRDALIEWNSMHSKATRIVLNPVGWETHSAPSLGTRAQAVINSQITNDSDIVIAAFWTRIGTPTGTERSGTVEEINEHVRSGRPAMLYFSSVPVVPDSVDPLQYEALRQFKAECMKLGLCEVYSSHQEFYSKIRRQIAITVNTHSYFRAFLETSERVEQPLEGPQLPRISADARDVLVAAALDDGELWTFESLDGVTFRAGMRTFGNDVSGKEAARWRAAFDQLVELGLARRVNEQLLRLTSKGVDVAALYTNG